MDVIRREYPQYTQNATAAVEPMKNVLLDAVETRLLVLMGAVLFVLLVACANLANLLLARASARRREVAVRHALGARRARIVRQMLTESVLLAAIGGAAGLALGAALLRLLLAFLPENLPRLKGVELDSSMLLFTAVVSLACGMLFGAVPALPLGRRTDGCRARRHARQRSRPVRAGDARGLGAGAGAGAHTASSARTTFRPSASRC